MCFNLTRNCVGEKQWSKETHFTSWMNKRDWLESRCRLCVSYDNLVLLLINASGKIVFVVQLIGLDASRLIWQYVATQAIISSPHERQKVTAATYLILHVMCIHKDGMEIQENGAYTSEQMKIYTMLMGMGGVQGQPTENSFVWPTVAPDNDWLGSSRNQGNIDLHSWSHVLAVLWYSGVVGYWTRKEV